MDDTSTDATALLSEAREGREAALSDLRTLVYEELRGIARNQLRGERDDHTLRTTGLVHEVYLKLVDQDRTSWEDRQHFYAVAAQAMRRVLVDHARRRNAQKRGWRRPKDLD
jgi:ECF sigma factor.